MHTLGHTFVPPPVHAGGLRAHNIAQSVSCAVELGLMEAVALPQTACFEAGVLFARAEGILPAPESTHAIRGAVDEALRCREEGRSRTILFGLSGHGHFDMSAYDAYFAGKLEDVELSQSRIDAAIEELPRVPAMS